jgi:hypothetical protein
MEEVDRVLGNSAVIVGLLDLLKKQGILNAGARREIQASAFAWLTTQIRPEREKPVQEYIRTTYHLTNR